MTNVATGSVGRRSKIFKERNRGGRYEAAVPRSAAAQQSGLRFFEAARSTRRSRVAAYVNF
jgi:hypothetical protein